jgi:hypothetical protein
MSKNNKVGAYKRGAYQSVLAKIRTKQVVTRSFVESIYSGMGKSPTASSASATVLLSSRKEDSKRGKFGNCLGNRSCDGIHYYMIPLKHVKGEEKKFRFHLCTPVEIASRTEIDTKRLEIINAGKVDKTPKTSKKVVKVKKTVKAKKVKVVTAPEVKAVVTAPAPEAIVEKAEKVEEPIVAE